MIDTLRTVPWENVAIVAFFALVALALLLRWAGKRLDKRRPGTGTRLARIANVLSAVMTLAGLGWSAEAMWVIAHEKIGLNVAYTIFVFGVFEMALLVSMIRANTHMKDNKWPGRPGRTVWGMALFMGIVACTIATHGLPEYLVRFSVPLVVAKLWWDGVVGGETKPETEESEWTITPAKLLVWVGLKRRKATASDRDRVITRATDLAFLREHGSKRLRSRREWRLRELSLRLDDAGLAQVREALTRATWFEVAQPVDAPVTHPAHRGDARNGAPLTRAKGLLTSGDARDADPATQAAHLIMLGEYDSIRGAAAAVGASPSTVGRRLEKLGGAPGDARNGAPVAHLNGKAVTH